MPSPGYTVTGDKVEPALPSAAFRLQIDGGEWYPRSDGLSVEIQTPEGTRSKMGMAHGGVPSVVTVLLLEEPPDGACIRLGYEVMVTAGRYRRARPADAAPQ